MVCENLWYTLIYDMLIYAGKSEDFHGDLCPFVWIANARQMQKQADEFQIIGHPTSWG